MEKRLYGGVLPFVFGEIKMGVLSSVVKQDAIQGSPWLKVGEVHFARPCGNTVMGCLGVLLNKSNSSENTMYIYKAKWN